MHRIAEDQIEPAPDLLTSVDTDYIRGVGKIGDRLIILLDLGRVITAQEREMLGGLDRELATA